MGGAGGIQDPLKLQYTCNLLYKNIMEEMTTLLSNFPVSLQLVAQKLKVKSMESRIEMEAQYDEDNRDGRTLRQKVLVLPRFSMYVVSMSTLVSCLMLA